MLDLRRGVWGGLRSNKLLMPIRGLSSGSRISQLDMRDEIGTSKRGIGTIFRSNGKKQLAKMEILKILLPVLRRSPLRMYCLVLVWHVSGLLYLDTTLEW